MELLGTGLDRAELDWKNRLKLAAATMCSVVAASNLGGLAATTEAATVADSPTPVSAANYPPVRIDHATETLCGNPPVSAPVPRQRRAMRCLTNAARVDYDLAPLADAPALDESASLKTRDVAHCGFSHDACDKPWNYYTRALAPQYSPVGENLAYGGGWGGSALQMFNALMRSEDHRENILRPSYRYLGVAEQRDGDITYWTMHFGSAE